MSAFTLVAPSGDTTRATDTAAIMAAGTGTVNLLKGTYYWTGGTLWPLGLNAIGQGWSAVGTLGAGTSITTTDSSFIVQATGASNATVIHGIEFTNGFQVRKQNTTFINCRTVGFIVGDNTTSCSPYYTKTVGHRFEAVSNGTAISFQNGASGTNLQGSLLVASGGRGIDCTSGSMFGNRCEMTVDIAAGATSIKSVLYFSGASFDNQFEFQYFDSGLIGLSYQDGAHIVFANGAYDNVVHVHTSSGAGLRVYNQQAASGNFNYVDVAASPRELYIFGNFSWDYSASDKVHSNSATAIYLPPTWLRLGRLEFQGDTKNVLAYASSYVTAASVNAAGTSGTPGTYYQDISDTNTVSGHGCTVQITINASGNMSAVTMRYPGWQKSSSTLASPITVTVVPGLTGASISLTSMTEYQLSGGGIQFNPAVPVADFAVNTFSNEAPQKWWVCAPEFPPNNLYTAGNTGAAPVPDLKNALNQSWSLNANTTWGTPLNPGFIGQQLCLFVSSLGSFTTAWNSIYRNAPAWPASGSSGKKATAIFRWDGTSWQFTGGSSAFA
jgi:hypothetical protein